MLPVFALDDHRVLVQAAACNNAMKYEKALALLNDIIHRNPRLREAYEERAIAYFELNKMDEAIRDYQASKTDIPGYPIPGYTIDPTIFTTFALDGQKRTPKIACYYSAINLDFSRGLLEGACRGSSDGTIEFVHCIRGSLNTLWAFVWSPCEVSKELIEAIIEVAEFIAYTPMWELLECMVPEVFELRREWEHWSEHVRGWKMGYMLGKYGIGVFLYISGGKLLNAYTDLRRANMMGILECNTKNCRAIMRESGKCAEVAQCAIKKVQAGRVVASHSSAPGHVLQEHHRWNRFIKLTGNKEADFKKVAEFLEKHEVFKWKKERYEPKDFFEGVFTAYEYTGTIENETVVAIFDLNELGVPLLRNGWVKDRSPPYKPGA